MADLAAIERDAVEASASQRPDALAGARKELRKKKKKNADMSFDIEDYELEGALGFNAPYMRDATQGRNASSHFRRREKIADPALSSQS